MVKRRSWKRNTLNPTKGSLLEARFVYERFSLLGNERILVPEVKKLAYIADYEIDDNGEVVPSLRQLDYNGGMSEMPLYVNFKKVIIELM